MMKDKVNLNNSTFGLDVKVSYLQFSYFELILFFYSANHVVNSTINYMTAL